MWFWNQTYKGKWNKVADALSLHANLLFASSNCKYDLENHISSARNSNREYHCLKEKTAKNEQNQVKIDFILKQQGLLLHKK